MQSFNYHSFLRQIKLINDRYSKISNITGENFNIFRILKLEHSEKNHTALIAELLNPKGKHGQGHTFLDLFIKLSCFKGKLITASSCKVETEKHIGFKSKDRLDGGRIDILITDATNNHSIIIENKIHASDVDSQLISYYNHSTESDLIYLTLDGTDPDTSSSHHLVKDTHFKCLSYKKDIIKWLELCRNEVAVLPIVRESITIYINTIKHLTNQTVNHAMQDELSEVIKSNIQASFIISDNLDAALDKIFIDYRNTLEQTLQNEGLKVYSTVNLDNNWTGIFINKPDWKYYNIGFQFQDYDKDLRYGFIAKHDPIKNKIPQNLIDQLKTIPGGNSKPNPWWGWYNAVGSPFDNWSKYPAWDAIMNGQMLDMMLTKIKELQTRTVDTQL